MYVHVLCLYVAIDVLHVYRCTNIYLIMGCTNYTGIYASDHVENDQEIYVVKKRTLENLCSSIIPPCSCANYGTWYIASIKQVVKYSHFPECSRFLSSKLPFQGFGLNFGNYFFV